jgi:hypothetical protein
MLKRQYDIELADRKPEVRAYLEKKEFMIIEPSAPYTGAELGGAERSGVWPKIRLVQWPLQQISPTICGRKCLALQCIFIIAHRNTLTTGNRLMTDFTHESLIGMV